MLKAYVGVANQHGLEVLWPEQDNTIPLVLSRAYRRRRQPAVSFWAVLPDSAAEQAQLLLAAAQSLAALRTVDTCSTSLGPILPSPSLLEGELHCLRPSPGGPATRD